jgi:hypothetical protein
MSYCMPCGRDNCASCTEASDLKEEIERLQAENKAMREALEFYAHIGNWNDSSFVDDDCEEVGTMSHCGRYRETAGGKRSRETLAKINQEKEK